MGKVTYSDIGYIKINNKNIYINSKENINIKEKEIELNIINLSKEVIY